MFNQIVNDDICVTEAKEDATALVFRLLPTFLAVAQDNRYSFDVPEIEQRTITLQTQSSADCLKLAGFSSLPSTSPKSIF